MKCKETSTITIENGEVKSSQPINQQDAAKLNLIKLFINEARPISCFRVGLSYHGNHPIEANIANIPARTSQPPIT